VTDTLPDRGHAAAGEPSGRTEVDLRRELAAVYRLVAHFGMTDLIFTHISLRIPGPSTTS
jgi:hypothetical protein